jgi:uncharacterized membrane protein
VEFFVMQIIIYFLLRILEFFYIRVTRMGYHHEDKTSAMYVTEERQAKEKGFRC